MWYYRKLLKIIWVDKVKNKEFLNFINQKRSLYASIKRRRGKLIGHTLRHERLAGKILGGTEWEVKGKVDKDQNR